MAWNQRMSLGGSLPEVTLPALPFRLSLSFGKRLTYAELQRAEGAAISVEPAIGCLFL